jgi:hypothetical protein
MDTIMPDLDSGSLPPLIEGALPILHIPDGDGMARSVMLEALARLNAMEKMQMAGAVFTRRQIEGLGWPQGTHIDWVVMRRLGPPMAPAQPRASEREMMLEQRVLRLEMLVRHLYQQSDFSVE